MSEKSAADQIVDRGMRPKLSGNTTRHNGAPVPSENISATAGPQVQTFSMTFTSLKSSHTLTARTFQSVSLTQRATALSVSCTSPRTYPNTPRQTCSSLVRSPRWLFASLLLLVSRAPQIPGATSTASLFASTPKRATTTSWVTTPQPSSFVTA